MKTKVIAISFLLFCCLVLNGSLMAEERNLSSQMPNSNNDDRSILKPAMAEQLMSECLINSMTEEDKRKLIRLLFIALSQNPNVSDLSNNTPAVREEVARDASKVLDAMLLDKCLAQAHNLLKDRNTEGLGNAFEKINSLLYWGLVKHPSVESAVDNYLEYMDVGRIEREFGKD
jgi:hypothetical protein